MLWRSPTLNSNGSWGPELKELPLCSVLLWFCWGLLASAAHLLLDVLELLLQLLHVSVDVGVVFVPLQGRDVSAGCLGATTQQRVENKSAIQATGTSRTDGGIMAASKCDRIKARRLVKRNLYCTSNMNGVRQHYCLNRFFQVFAARGQRKRHKSNDATVWLARTPARCLHSHLGFLFLHKKNSKTNKHKLEREDVKQQMMKWWTEAKLQWCLRQV